MLYVGTKILEGSVKVCEGVWCLVLRYSHLSRFNIIISRAIDKATLLVDNSEYISREKWLIVEI